MTLWFDINHPDLNQKFLYSYDPYDNQYFSSNHLKNNHGTTQSSFIASHTDGGGDLAGIGFNCKMIGYQAWDGDYIQRAHHASLAMNADVITSSAGGWTCTSYINPMEKLALKEILDNGTVVVMPAGNGWNGANCNYNGQMHAFKPLSPEYDERVIMVTGVDKNDKHQVFNDNGGEVTQSHFPEVDVCAPGFTMMGATCTIGSDGLPNTWPYYGNSSGTSFAAPIVAGLCGLLKSINQDLTPAEIQHIIKSTTDPVVDANLFTGVIGTGRINAYRAVQMASDCSPIIITGNETWNENRVIICGLVIKSGATLTISSTVQLSKHSKIIVEEGAKLILNSGSLTSLDNNPWQGIEVWGNSTAHQWPDAYGNYQQGRVILNDATIENSICALNLWKPGDYTKTGGIVFATNSVFMNNAKSVHTLHYRNFHPTNGKEMDYNTWFNSCTFEITAAYPGTHTFYKHVDLNQVNGIQFKSCDFSLSPQAQNVSDYNQAIAAYSSGFRVSANCTGNYTPCSTWDMSTFNGFRVGIYAGNGSFKNYTYTVNRAIFNGNSIGILSNLVNNAIVINSEFHAAKNQYNWEDCTYGIFVEAASLFTIEDNKFFKQEGAPQSNYIGIGVFNCQAVADVYKNEFTGLTAGNYAYGKNYFQDFYSGLEYLCNTNTGNWADFYVTGVDTLLNNGIQSKQGSTIMPARNSFSPTGATWHFYNETKNLVGYYYCQSCPGHYPEYVENVTRELVSVIGTCPSHYGGDNPTREIVLSPDVKLNVETEFALADLTLQGVKTLYNNLKDGGNTPDTKFDVETALPSEMWELRAKLLGDSPHLSTEVLKLVADRIDVFSESAIFDILSANPDELKKEELIKYLEEKENPLPEYMISILKQVASGTTYRTVLEMEMAKYSHDRSRAASDIIRSILNSEELDVAQLRLWLSNLGGIEAERQIIASYVHQGDFSLAMALAETLPITYQLEGETLLDHNQFVSLLQLQQNITNSGHVIEQLTQDEQEMLSVIAESESAVSSPIAKAILESFYGANFERCKAIEGTASYKNQPVNPNQLAQTYGLNITVKPNPADEWAAFDYTLPEGTESASLDILDANGKPVETFALKGNRGQKLVDTHTWPAGHYVYTIKVAGFTQSGKLIVVK